MRHFPKGETNEPLKAEVPIGQGCGPLTYLTELNQSVFQTNLDFILFCLVCFYDSNGWNF